MIGIGEVQNEVAYANAVGQAALGVKHGAMKRNKGDD